MSTPYQLRDLVLPRSMLGVVRNAAAQRRIAGLPPANLFQHAYGHGFFRHVFRRNAALTEAAARGRRAFDDFVALGRYPYDLEVVEKTGPSVRVRDVRGRERVLLDLVTNSYNDLESLAPTRDALTRYVREEPLSSCLSRKIAGRFTVHRALEEELADFLGYDAAVLSTCGYIAQLSTVFSLFREGDVVFADELNHSSLIDGCRLSRAKVIVFRHLDYDHLATLLRRHRGRHNVAGIVSDGVFSTKGVTADVDRICDLAASFRCASVIDDTHGVGVVGRRGRGVLDLFDARPDIVTGGFSKGLGAFGGFAVASRELALVIDHLGRQNINTSHLSPVAAAQSLIHLRHYRAHHGELSTELGARLRAFNAALDAHGLAYYRSPEAHLHPIFSFSARAESEALGRLEALMDAGYLASFFPHPVCPRPTLRFSVHRAVPVHELQRLAGLLATMDLAAAA